MTHEEKDLVLEDLVSRLPYDVQGFYKTSGIEIINQKLTYDIIGNLEYKNNVEFKPYLFPLSSMSEEQCKEFLEISHTTKGLNIYAQVILYSLIVAIISFICIILIITP